MKNPHVRRFAPSLALALASMSPRALLAQQPYVAPTAPPMPYPAPTATVAPSKGAPPASAAPPASEPPAPASSAPPAHVAAPAAGAAPPEGHAAASPPPVAARAAPAPAEGEVVSRKTRGAELSLELGGAFTAGAHFPEDTAARNVEEAIDAAYGLGLWFLPTSEFALGIAVERIGFGKDHYATDALGQTLNASYSADTLWLGARFYFSDERPAFYIGLAAGPALPRVRATGTRATTNPFTTPPQPFECTAAGRIGGGLAAAAGVEFDIGDAWSLVSEARATAHALGQSAADLDGCAPGSGPAVVGSLRVGFAYRFEL